MSSTIYLWNIIAVDGESDGIESVESDLGSDQEEWNDEGETMGGMDPEGILHHRYPDSIPSNHQNQSSIYSIIRLPTTTNR